MVTDRGWRPVARQGRCTGRPGRGTVTLAVLVWLLSGCTPPGLPPAVAPAPSSVVGSRPAADAAFTVGVDGAVVGFNPHAIADYSPVDAAVAELVLPSVAVTAADGSVRLDTDVVRTAEVTMAAPFTVTYTLDRNASWSDGTPITAEDFSYLRDQMLVQPGTVDPAGYRLITSIVSRDAGKSVDVVFSRVVPDWMSLFSPLLPSHILKDSPGGWTTGLASGLPVSGNRYKMLSYDTVTGEITLVRNDKYWGPQPGPSTAVLRVGTPAALLQALVRGDLQAVLLRPDAADQRALQAAVPAGRRFAVPLPGTIQLVFNTGGGPTADQNVRRAIAAGLDVPAIRSLLDGGNPAGGAAVSSLVSLPRAGDGATAGPAADVATAVADLAAAGYHRESLYMNKNGQPLRLTLAYAGGDDRTAAAARLIQSELAAVGIEIDLSVQAPRGLVNDRLALGTADLGLLMVNRGPSDALSALSAFGCPLPPVVSVENTRRARPRAGNLSGYCSPSVQAQLDGAVGGAASAGLPGELSTALPVLPLSRPSAVLATSASIAAQIGNSSTGWTYSGALSGLPEWPSH